MCYDLSSRPPLPPVRGGNVGVEAQEAVLEAADGNRFAAYRAVSGEPGGPGVVVLPDIRGLHPFYQDLAVRFAEAGVHAIALDLFGRTAGVGSGEARGEGFDSAPHVQAVEPDTLALDVAAALEYLRSDRGGGAEHVFTMGFCFGGRNSFNQAARDHGLSGVIGFYGWPVPRRPGDEEAPVLRTPRYRCPVLGLFGGADERIPAEDVEAFRNALESAGIEHEIKVYEGAPHSFFDRAQAEHASASEDAWERMLRFIERESA